MAYTEQDVDRLIMEVGMMKAKRKADLMHPPVVVVPYIGTDKDKAPAVPDADVAAEMEMAELERDSPSVAFEKDTFGLRLRMRDPLTGKIHVICQPEEEGKTEKFMTAKAVNDLLVAGRKPVLEKRKADAVAAKAAADKAFAEANKPGPVTAHGGSVMAAVGH
jgi:hypothetical protein